MTKKGTIKFGSSFSKEKDPKFNKGQFVEVLDENILFSKDLKDRDGFILDVEIKDDVVIYLVISCTEYAIRLRSKIFDCKGSMLAIKLKGDFRRKKIYPSMFELTHYFIPENQLVALSDEVEDNFFNFVYKLLPKDTHNDSYIKFYENKGWDSRLPGD